MQEALLSPSEKLWEFTFAAERFGERKCLEETTQRKDENTAWSERSELHKCEGNELKYC